MWATDYNESFPGAPQMIGERIRPLTAEEASGVGGGAMGFYDVN